MPNVDFVLSNNNSNFFSVQSDVSEEPLVEIIDKDGVRVENNIQEFKIIDNPKKSLSLGAMKFGFHGLSITMF